MEALLLLYSMGMYPDKFNIRGSVMGLPPADMPEATPRASRTPIAIKRVFGSASISLVTIPRRYLTYRIEKYTATYLQWITMNYVTIGTLYIDKCISMSKELNGLFYIS